jgi:hypothetical protein
MCIVARNLVLTFVDDVLKILDSCSKALMISYWISEHYSKHG